MLEVLGSSDVVLPLLASAMSTPASLASNLASNLASDLASNLASNLEQSQAGPRMQARHKKAHAKPAQAELSSAVSEHAQHLQHTVPAAAAQLGLEASDAGQLPAAPVDGETALPSVPGQIPASSRAAACHPAGLPSSEASAQAAPDQSSGQLQFAPKASGSEHLHKDHKQEPSTSGHDMQTDVPVWLQPMVPLPGVNQSPAASSQQADSRRQQQEELREPQHVMQAASALNTMRPPRLVGMPFQQAYGQVLAPVDLQQLSPSSLPQHQHAVGLEPASSKSEAHKGPVVAPVHAQHGYNSMVSAAEPLPVSQADASRSRDVDMHEAQPAFEWQEQAGTGNKRGQDALHLSHQTAPQAAEDSAVSGPQQAQHAEQSLEHEGTAQHPAQPDAQESTHCPAASTTYDTTGSCCHSAAQNQYQDNEHTGTARAAAHCSGVMPGEPVVSSRKHAQRHLQNAAPLPWQESEGKCAILPEG